MAKSRDSYTMGYETSAMRMFESRTAEANAGFFLDDLKPGMRLLDLGCGPGSITVGLAERVAPGQVTGVDIEPTQIARATARAEGMGLQNCAFVVASAHELPLADASVDVVFSHAVLVHLPQIERVLSEIDRVLAPGGLVGLREPILQSNIYHSDDSALRQVFEIMQRVVIQKGADADLGRELPGRFASRGYRILQAKAVVASTGTPQGKAGMYETMAQFWLEGSFSADAVDLGIIDPAARQALADRLVEEGRDPASFNGTAFIEMVARKAG